MQVRWDQGVESQVRHSGVNGFILGSYHPGKHGDGEIPNKEFMFKWVMLDFSTNHRFSHFFSNRLKMTCTKLNVTMMFFAQLNWKGVVVGFSLNHVEIWHF